MPAKHPLFASRSSGVLFLSAELSKLFDSINVTDMVQTYLVYGRDFHPEMITQVQDIEGSKSTAITTWGVLLDSLIANLVNIRIRDLTTVYTKAAINVALFRNF